MEPLRADGSVATGSELIDLIIDVFTAYSDGLPMVYQEFPDDTIPEDITFPAITCQINEKLPLIAGAGYTTRTNEESLHGGTRLGSGQRPTGYRKPRFRQQFLDTENPGHSLTVKNMQHWYVLKFDVWATNNRVADNICEQLEEFMATFSGFLERRGVIAVTFDGRKAGDMVNWKDQLHKRTIKYGIILENIYVSSTKNIEEILRKFSVEQEDLFGSTEESN